MNFIHGISTGEDLLGRIPYIIALCEMRGMGDTATILRALEEQALGTADVADACAAYAEAVTIRSRMQAIKDEVSEFLLELSKELPVKRQRDKAIALARKVQRC